jgi:hypothetical protein
METTDQKKVIITLRVALSILGFVILLAGTATGAWIALSGRVTNVEHDLEELEDKVDQNKVDSEEADAMHIKLINDGVKAQYAVGASLAAIQKDIKYILLMFESIQEKMK